MTEFGRGKRCRSLLGSFRTLKARVTSRFGCAMLSEKTMSASNLLDVEIGRAMNEADSQLEFLLDLRLSRQPRNTSSDMIQAIEEFASYKSRFDRNGQISSNP